MTRLIDADSIPWDVDGVGTIHVVTKEEIDRMPAVDAEPVRHGHIEANGYTYTCSVCESRLFEHDLFWRYCPYCGARLEDEEE
jgi:hypothetical protein